MTSPRLSCFALLLVLTSSALAQSTILSEKEAIYFQTSASAPVAATPFGIPQYEAAFQTPASGTVTPPGLSPLAIPFNANQNTYQLNGYYSTKAALDAAFPNGTFQLAVTGFPTVSSSITGDLYPAVIPQLTGGGAWQNNILVVNPAVSTTFTFTNFSTYTSLGGGQVAGAMSFQLQSASGQDNINLKQQIATQAVGGLTQAAAPFTTYTIPAGMLKAGASYQATLNFDNVTTLNSTAISGGVVVGLYANYTTFFVSAQKTSPPGPPVITLQPVSVSGPLGSSVTFTASYSATNDPTFQTNFLWNLNGSSLQGGTSKYTFGPNLNVTINNLTAADVGTYSLYVFNSAGLTVANVVTVSIGAAAAPPVITSQPNLTASSLTVNGTASGTTVALTAGASNATAYQWRINGANVIQGNASGVNGSTLIITGASAINAGSYTCVVSNSAGSVTSNAVQLNTILNPPSPGRLGNLSVLTVAGNGASPLTLGFVVGGAGTTGTQSLLVRGDGPLIAAAPFNVAGTMADPVITLQGGSLVAPVVNDNWGSNQAQIISAEANTFAYGLTTGSLDAALVAALAPGNYTVQVTGNGASVGTVLAEVFDNTPSGAYTTATPRLGNLSCLAKVNGGSTLTAGFVVGGTTAKTVLIRATGPALAIAPFNLTGTMPDPQLTVHGTTSGGQDVILASNAGWGGNAQITAIDSTVFAFALTNPSSNDSAVVVTLPPGNYTAQVSSISGTAGTALVEVYEVP
jgi:hypothetical protein